MDPDATTEPTWTRSRLLIGLTLVTSGVLVTIDQWTDIFQIAVRDEESSHIFLVPVVAVWLIWCRRDQLRDLNPIWSIAGPFLIAAGWLTVSIGFNHNLQALRHGGAITVVTGCLVTATSVQMLQRLLPAFIVLGFLVPVPNLIRQEIAIPLQSATAQATEFIGHLFGMDVMRYANRLSYNGVDIEIAEACNGMRMVFALILVTYAVAFALRLRPSVRVSIIILSPVFAIACNVLRTLPTLWIYGHFPEAIGDAFHDISGWLMVFVAFGLILGMIQTLHWAQIPIMQSTSALRTTP